MSRTVALALMAGLMLFATALRLGRISAKDIWVDEANSILIAEQPIPQIVEALRLDSSPPLFYVMLHYWMRAFGQSEAAVRSLSALFGALLVGAVFHVGRRIASDRVGLYAGLLVAIAPIQIAHSQEVRMYALLPLAALGAMYFTFRCAQSGRRTDAAALALCTLAGLYTHNYALFLAPAQVLFVLISRSLKTRLKLWLAVGAVVAVGYLPWLPVFFQQLDNQGQYAWLVPIWERWGMMAVWNTFTTFAVGWGEISPVNATTPDILVAVTPLLWGLAILTLVRRAPNRTDRPMILLLLCYLVVPLVAAFAVSLLGSPCYVPGRCDQLVYPAFALLAAAGMTRIRSLNARVAIAASVVLCLGATLFFHYRGNAKPGDRAYSMAVLNDARDGQTVICTSLTRAQLEYYARRHGKNLNILSYPRDTAHHLGNQDDEDLLTNPRHLADEAQAVLAEMTRLCAQGDEFILIAVRTRVNAELYKMISERFGPEPVRILGSVSQSMLNLPISVLVFRVE